MRASRPRAPVAARPAPAAPTCGRRFALAASVAALFGATSCGGAAPLPPPPAQLDLTMREYSYDYRKRTIPRGRVVIRGDNKGRERHEIVLLRLPEDFPPLAEQLRSKQRRAITTLSRLRRISPGISDAFAADLTPGRYGMVCFVEARGGATHAAKGMSSEFRVR